MTALSNLTYFSNLTLFIIDFSIKFDLCLKLSGPRAVKCNFEQENDQGQRCWQGQSS